MNGPKSKISNVAMRAPPLSAMGLPVIIIGAPRSPRADVFIMTSVVVCGVCADTALTGFNPSSNRFPIILAGTRVNNKGLILFRVFVAGETVV